MTKLLSLAVLAFACASSPVLAQTATAPVKLEPVGGQTQIQEFVISVSDVEPFRRAFEDVFKWKVIEEGPAKASAIKLWGLAPKTRADTILFGNPASTYGHVRLVRFHDVPQEQIRPAGRWWDTGGMFNLNVLVKDAAATEAGLAKLGWRSVALPDTYEYPGGAKGVSQMMVGPDAVVVSFQERKSPPLKGWPAFEGATHIEVGYQLVNDVDAWYPFWKDVLGLPARPVRTRSTGKAVGPNDYGLPHNLVGVDDSRQGGVQPREGGEQLIGVRQFVNATGYDFADRAKAPNLGIMSIRLPFADIDPIIERAKAAGIPFAAEPQVVEMAPYGTVKAVAFRAPVSGQWVELIEQGVQPMTRAEMLKLLEGGRTGTWQSFGGTAGGKMAYNGDGSGMVSWGSGQAVGTWTVKGNTICTAWTTMRDGREQCALYYQVGPNRYQSYQLDGTPDGFNSFD